jgi:2-polyprenyl-6-methoxyphenol hydroxylase-like FAD-dependent oxidoreductase
VRILIVGGGIAGLCLDLALHNTSWQVEVVERDPGHRLGAGLAIQPNPMRALRQLGVAGAVQRAGCVIGRFQYRDQHGALLCDVDLPGLWGDTGPFVGITRDALRRALLADRSRCRLGAVAAVAQHADHVVVSFADGTSAAYDLVVGADGINSVVRRCIVDLPGPTYSGHMAWRSVAPTGSDGLGGVQFFLGGDRFFGLCPVGDGLTYGFGNVATERVHEPVAGGRRRMLDRFADFAAPVRRYLASVRSDADIHCAPIESLPDAVWHEDRVVLIGDAAHAMSPMMGQGGCMAIEDAVVLADELRRDPDVPAALAAFAARRNTRVGWVREQSQALGELIRLPAPVRNHALRERGTAAFHERYRPLVAAP